jgi:hypothetical protein
LQRQLESLERDLTDSTPSPVAKAREIYQDVLALGKEFPDMRIESKQQEAIVTTEPIELDGVSLGSFDIVLNLNSLPDASYSIKACEPNPASSNLSVTHPHVQDEKLCEGDGRLAIRAALAEGRL